MAREKFYKTKKDSIYYYFNSSGEKKYAYRYKFYNSQQKRVEKTARNFATEKEAERALLELRADVLDDRLVYVENHDLLVKDWFQTYIDLRSSRWKVSTIRHYTESINNHIIPCLGDFKLNKLTNLIIQEELVDKLLEKGLNKSTVNNILRVFKAGLNYAVKKELLKKNPIHDLIYDEAPERTKDQFYSEEELQEFLRCVRLDGSPTRRAIFTTLAMTGMRRGEAMGLRWSDIDFKDMTISITKTRDRHGERSPKTKRSIRKVHINEVLAEELRAYYAWSIKAKWQANIEPAEDDYVFITVRQLTPINGSYTIDAMKAICEKYNLRRIKTHGLRHTFASILLSRNTPLITVAEMLGDHPTTVNNIYAHSLVKKETEASALLDTLFKTV